MPVKLPRLFRRNRPARLSGDVEAHAPYMLRSRAILRARVEWESALVLSLAREIEPDADAVMRWFTGDRIREFGDKTAAQLVEEGATSRLLGMMVAIRNGRRDD
jgi:hypothetical protein